MLHRAVFLVVLFMGSGALRAQISVFPDGPFPPLLAGLFGGELFQSNGRAVKVSGLTTLIFTNGTDSHGGLLLAQANKARLEQNGTDVTATLVASPGP